MCIHIYRSKGSHAPIADRRDSHQVLIIFMNKIVGSRTQGFLDDQIATMKDKDIKWCAPIADRRR